MQLGADGSRMFALGRDRVLRIWNNRLITLSQPDLMTAWELEECELPPDALSDYAKLLAGRELSTAGVMVPLKPRDLAN